MTKKPNVEDVPYYTEQDIRAQQEVTKSIRRALSRGEVPNVPLLQKQKGTKHTYKGRRVEYGDVDLDSHIVPLLQVLNRKGFDTLGSCEGHSDGSNMSEAFVTFEYGKKSNPDNMKFALTSLPGVAKIEKEPNFWSISVHGNSRMDIDEKFNKISGAVLKTPIHDLYDVVKVHLPVGKYYVCSGNSNHVYPTGQSVYHKGSSYICPVCGKSLKLNA